jgi:CheY-like chemotaxis protein
VDNALKFTRHGSVAIDCTRLDGDLELTVSDTGIGVEAQELALLCQPFFRGQAARDAESDGIGLGLANATRMVQLMDGRLAIESVRGEGTTVRVQLPRWSGPAQARPAAPEVFDGVRFERVLVIDDDRGAREAISLWLSSAGCEVLQAAHYGAAVAGCEARAFQPDLLMVDYRLGESLDGLHAIARLRKRFGPVEAMLVTGEPLDEATLPGNVVLLRKPLHPERLEALLGRA